MSGVTCSGRPSVSILARTCARACFGLGQVVVGVGLAQFDEGVGDAFPGQSLAQCPQGVDHARHAGVPAKEDEPAVLLVNHPLIVDQRTAQVEHPPQHGHVVGLSLDDVGEKDIGLVWLKGPLRDLFDAKDDGAGDRSSWTGMPASANSAR